MELELKDNGLLVSSDQKSVAQSNLHKAYSPGSIVEIRFEKTSTSSEYIVNSSLLRTDKTKANDYDTCKSIVATLTDTPSSLEMRKAVVHRKSHFLSMESIASTAMYNVLLKFPVVKEVPQEFKLVSMA